MGTKRVPSKMFWFSLLIPFLILTSMLIKPVTTTINGEEILLATIPVDPRDLFYGDYVILDLEIEQIDATLLEPKFKEKLEKSTFYRDIPVYVSLEEGENGVYQTVSVSDTKPVGFFMKGKMNPYIQGNSWDEDAVYKETVHIDYGIDRYYVEEGTGLEFEEQASKGKVLISVKIHNGYPLLTGIKNIQ